MSEGVRVPCLHIYQENTVESIYTQLESRNGKKKKRASWNGTYMRIVETTLFLPDINTDS